MKIWPPCENVKPPATVVISQKNLKFYSDKIFIKNNLWFFWHQQYEFDFISGQPEVASESKFGYFQVFTHYLHHLKNRNLCSLGFTISSYFDFSEDFKKIANFGHFRNIFGSYSVNDTFSKLQHVIICN